MYILQSVLNTRIYRIQGLFSLCFVLPNLVLLSRLSYVHPYSVDSRELPSLVSVAQAWPYVVYLVRCSRGKHSNIVAMQRAFMDLFRFMFRNLDGWQRERAGLYS